MEEPVGICLLKRNNGDAKKMCYICSKLTIKTLELLTLLLLTSTDLKHCSGVAIVDFQQVDLG